MISSRVAFPFLRIVFGLVFGVTFAKENKLNFNEKKDIYRDVISDFKDGEQRPMFSALIEKVRRGE